MVTMKQIAKETNTSQATVSRVLNGNMSVSFEIRNRVMECAKKHNYQPNVYAQNLVSKMSLLIGVIIPDISNPFFAELVKHIEHEASKYGYSIILCNTNGSDVKEKYYINILKRYKAAGIIMVPWNVNEQYFINLKDDDTPIIISTICVDGFDCISISYYDAGVNVANYLIGMGYENFAFVGNKNEDKEKGFIKGLLNNGYNADKCYTFLDLVDNALKDSIMNLVNINNKNFGIFAANDIIALSIMDFLKDNNIMVPGEVSLIGFDNTFIGKAVSPSISSVAQPIDEIGKQSIDMLIEKILNKNKYFGKHIILESRVVVRESTLKSTTLKNKF